MISHIDFDIGRSIPVFDIIKEKMNFYQKNVQIIDKTLSVPQFSSYKNIGKIIKPGEILKHKIDNSSSIRMEYVSHEYETYWFQILHLAFMNPSSKCIKPDFFSDNDELFLQMKKELDNKINTIPGNAMLTAFSTKTGEVYKFPFSVYCTIMIDKNNKDCSLLIKNFISPRKEHFEDINIINKL